MGGKLNNNGSADCDTGRRPGLAVDAVRRLQTIWAATHIAITTEVKVYESLALSILMYNTETWTVTADTQRRLRVFEMDGLRRTAGVTRMHRRRNRDIKASPNNQDDVAQKLEIRCLRYFGHVCRMDLHRLPYSCLHGRVEGQMSRSFKEKKRLRKGELQLQRS